MVKANGQDCGSNFDREKLRRTNPTAYREYLRIEKFIEDYRQKLANNPNARLIDENGTITIPVVFHVLHRGEAIGTGTNITDAQIIGQMATLNQCFSQTNNQAGVVAAYVPLIANPNFRFELACTDPSGITSSGITRQQSTIVNFLSATDNAKKSSLGGADPWPVERYLNVWVTPNVDVPVGIFYGYSSDLNTLVSNPNVDGVVVRFDAIGANPNNALGRNGGRTLVHEIGHWLSLFHLFDDGCSNNDGCGDTPAQAARTSESVACPIAFKNSCGNNSNGDMFDNFMDGTNETCGRRMFTRDQVTRMRAVFQQGGPRRSFIDNYFTLTKLYASCSLGYYLVKTPFCAANSNISWSLTGPATTSFYPSTFATVYPQAGANGTAILTASWNNNSASISIPIGYGQESSTYNANYYNSGNVAMTSGSVNMTSYNNWTYGQVSFAGATGPAKNWRLVSCNSCNPQTYFSGNGNSFGVYLTQPYAFAKIRAEVPAICGDVTIEYSFLGGYLNPSYGISPNPASNSITISATGLADDPNARVANQTAYEVQIFNRYSQLIKKTTCPRGTNDVQVDVSSFPSNQFYTVKLISANDVQTKSFFKQ